MEELKPINPYALAKLKAARHRLNCKQYTTIRGQILAGDADGAMKGLKRLLKNNGEAAR